MKSPLISASARRIPIHRTDSTHRTSSAPFPSSSSTLPHPGAEPTQPHRSRRRHRSVGTIAKKFFLFSISTLVIILILRVIATPHHREVMFNSLHSSINYISSAIRSFLPFMAAVPLSTLRINIPNLKIYSHAEVLSSFQQSIPGMSNRLYKGQAGKIAIVGGSREYTGAPYFAAITALRVGADLSHVFCHPASAPIIKTYSPELIVHPLNDSDQAATLNATLFEQWLDRINSVVLGPGLGREPDAIALAHSVIELTRTRRIPLVIDGDGLWIVSQDPRVIKDHPLLILTPNHIEFLRIYAAVISPSSTRGSSSSEEETVVQEVVELSRALGNITILKKGEIDVISDGNHAVLCQLEGSPRRCGGQGDLTSGSIGAFAFWTTTAKQSDVPPLLSASYAGVALTKWCSNAAFVKHHRAMLASDMIAEIGSQFSLHLDSSVQSRI